ncbi:uncharacterized protein KY384_004078 [Bacidia gigantensis]|uniref:uncharacterized protein n=1 Tax=Bacidia gigantensis TaxID=2732470 RepID=UPI001D03DCBF|nr:uncharacterized protein KY384_004078 [Bacidia gigantensis]KAG8530721.1 hypothetical protein KY384_004078 [Bacidia gigantensis]
MAVQYWLPRTFLTRPGPQVKKEIINFKDTEVPEYEDFYACVLDDVLSADECFNLVRAAKAQMNEQWEEAGVNVGYGRQELDPETRSCGRIIWDNSDLVARIWARCQNHVPEILQLKDKPGITGSGYLMRNQTYEMTQCNKRMRFLRYLDGNYFRREFSRAQTMHGLIPVLAHFDGNVRMHEDDDEEETSFITMHLYLNEADEDSLLVGGATTFHATDMTGRHVDVVPKVGRVLLFQQKGLLHSGADVKRGIKYTMRTDVMYKRVR